MLPCMAQNITIITGSSRGVGAALVEQLLQPGQVVLGIARQSNPGLQARADAAGIRLEQWQTNLTDSAAVAQRLRVWLAGFDPALVHQVTLINNAAQVGRLARLDQVPPGDVAAVLRVGLEAALVLTAAFLEMTDAWPARRCVLNVSSGLGRRPMAGSAAYCAAKAGLDHFSRCIALEQADHVNPAHVVSLAPGVIDTDMQAELRAADPQAFPERARFVKLQHDGVLISPQACARALLARLADPSFGHEVVGDLRA